MQARRISRSQDDAAHELGTATPLAGPGSPDDSQQTAAATPTEAASVALERPPEATTAGSPNCRRRRHHVACRAVTSQAWFVNREVDVSLGSTIVERIVIVNDSDREETYHLASTGLAAGWVTLRPAKITVAPGAQDDVEVEIRPPRLPGTAAGPTGLTIRISAAASRRRHARSDDHPRRPAGARPPPHAAVPGAARSSRGDLRADVGEPRQRAGELPDAIGGHDQPPRSRVPAAVGRRRSRRHGAGAGAAAHHAAAVGTAAAHAAVPDRRGADRRPDRHRQRHARCRHRCCRSGCGAG